MTIEKLKKRDGRLVSFDKEKIASAIAKAFEATYKPGQEDVAEALAEEDVTVTEVSLAPEAGGRVRLTVLLDYRGEALNMAVTV